MFFFQGKFSSFHEITTKFKKNWIHFLKREWKGEKERTYKQNQTDINTRNNFTSTDQNLLYTRCSRIKCTNRTEPLSSVWNVYQIFSFCIYESEKNVRAECYYLGVTWRTMVWSFDDKMAYTDYTHFQHTKWIDSEANISETYIEYFPYKNMKSIYKSTQCVRNGTVLLRMENNIIYIKPLSYFVYFKLFDAYSRWNIFAHNEFSFGMYFVFMWSSSVFLYFFFKFTSFAVLNHRK